LGAFAISLFPLARPTATSYPIPVLALQHRSFALKKPLHLLFVLLGCLHLIGGPYSVVQIYAWATMLVDYSKEDGFVQAAKDTFSGEKPCALCCKIKASEQQDTKEKSPLAPLSPLSGKLLHEMLPMGVISLVFPPASPTPPVTFTEVSFPAGIGPSSPPVPPPNRLS